MLIERKKTMEEHLDLEDPQRTIFSFLVGKKIFIGNPLVGNPFFPFHSVPPLFMFLIHLKTHHVKNEDEKQKRENRNLKRSDWRYFFFLFFHSREASRLSCFNLRICTAGAKTTERLKTANDYATSRVLDHANAYCCHRRRALSSGMAASITGDLET
jgi:hypothetical protein